MFTLGVSHPGVKIRYQFRREQKRRCGHKNGGHKKLNNGGHKKNDTMASAQRKPHPMSPASKTPLAVTLQQGLLYEPLIDVEIGSESLEESLKFQRLPQQEKQKIENNREQILNTAVPWGPYPMKSKDAGWALAYFEDEETCPYFCKSGDSKIDVNFAVVNTQKTADLVKLTIRQEIWDNDKQKVVFNGTTWTKMVSRSRAHDIIYAERANWEAYKESYRNIVQKAKQRNAAATMSAFSSIHSKNLRRKSPRRSPAGKNVGTKRPVKRKMF